MSSGDVLRFGPFCLDARSRELRRDGRPIPLRPKTFALLRFLAANPGRLLTKDEMLDAVWSDAAVGDAVLKVGIRELREALGDRAASPRYIETAHRLGYRFVAPVESHGLPERLTTFVGREAELAELRALLASRRLLTLTGAGGSGKTRLALELARRVAGDHPDGVWWVELDAITNPELLPAAVAAATGVRAAGARPLVEALVGALRDRRTLLVLDNCEHLVAAAAGLVAPLLHGTSGVTVLATSREPLGLEGETPWIVPPLSLPAEDEATADPERSEAVRLFVERVATVRPGFALDASTAPAIVRICRRLDGIPLALELAAARARVLSLDDVAARLDDGFRLLAGGTRDVPRHQTLRTAIDWSHELLDPDERRLFRRLSVFAGTFALDAVEAVCAKAPLTPDSVADVFARLVEKSLVVPGPEPGRYRLLEIVRKYAAAKLATREAGELEHGHTAHYLGVAESLAGRLNGPERRAVVARLGADLGNLRAAARRAIEAREAVSALRLVAALVWFWFHAGHWHEGRRSLDEALALAAPAEAPEARAMALFGSGLIAWTQGDPAVARERLRASTEAFGERGDDTGRGYATLFLAAAETSLGDEARARHLARDAVDAFGATGDEPFGRAAAAINLGIVSLAGGDEALAETSLEAGLTSAREIADEWLIALALRNLGLLDARRGRLARAAARLRESVVVLRDSGERWFLSRSFESLAGVLARLGDLEAAARLYGAGEALRETIGASVLPFYRPDYERGLDVLREALEPDALAALWQEGRALRIDAATDYALAVAAPRAIAQP